MYTLPKRIWTLVAAGALLACGGDGDGEVTPQTPTSLADGVDRVSGADAATGGAAAQGTGAPSSEGGAFAETFGVGVDAGSSAGAGASSGSGGAGSADGSTDTDLGAGADASDTEGLDPGEDSADPGETNGTTPLGAGTGTCCSDGDCLCHGDAPSALTSRSGPFRTERYTVSGVGCVFYPTDAEPPFAAVAVSDGFLGSGGCSSFQTGRWGPLYASHGIVAMVVNTGSLDQPAARGRALLRGIEAFKAENTRSGSPLFGKLAGRYGTSGFSMGGGGTTHASRQDDSLLSSVAIMPWGPVNSGISVPTLVICGASDGTAPCRSHGNRAYAGIPDSVPKMRVQVSGGHNGQPGAGGGDSGEYGLAFQKLFLEGDERWRSLLVSADAEESNLQ